MKIWQTPSGRGRNPDGSRPAPYDRVRAMQDKDDAITMTGASLGRVVNKTPHPVEIVDADHNVVRTYPPAAEMIRLAETVEPREPLPDGTPTSVTVFGDPTGLPDYDADTVYIVSQIVKAALPDRADLVVPAQVVRDDSGRIIGCRSLGW